MKAGIEKCDDANTNSGDGCNSSYIHLLSQTGFDQVDRPQQEIHALFVHQAGIKTMRQHQQHESHIEVTERKREQKSVTMEISMDNYKQEVKESGSGLYSTKRCKCSS